jgi:hypothetical protein
MREAFHWYAFWIPALVDDLFWPLTFVMVLVIYDRLLVIGCG